MQSGRAVVGLVGLLVRFVVNGFGCADAAERDVGRSGAVFLSDGCSGKENMLLLFELRGILRASVILNCTVVGRESVEM